MNLPDAKRQVSVAGGYVPRWSRSGRELFYTDGISLWSVAVAPGAVFSAGIPKRLFSTEPFASVGSNPFDVSPDGRRFLFSRALGSTAPRPDELIIVQHVFEELRAKAPPKK